MKSLQVTKFESSEGLSWLGTALRAQRLKAVKENRTAKHICAA